MKKITLFLLIVILIFSNTFIMAQGDKEKEEKKVPPGMEIMQAGNAELLVPKGMKTQKKGDLIVLETSEEYVARRLFDMDERLAKIEAEEKALAEKIEQLNKTLSEIQKSNPASNEKGNE